MAEIVKADVLQIENTQTGVYNALSPRFSGYATDTKYEMHMFTGGNVELYPPESKLNIFGLTGIQGQPGLQGETGVAGLQGVTGLQGQTGVLGTDYIEGGYTGTSYGITAVAYPYIEYTMLKNKIVTLKIPPFGGISPPYPIGGYSVFRIDNMPTGIAPEYGLVVACPGISILSIGPTGLDYVGPVDIYIGSVEGGGGSYEYLPGIAFNIGASFDMQGGPKSLNNTVSISYMR